MVYIRWSLLSFSNHCWYCFISVDLVLSCLNLVDVVCFMTAAANRIQWEITSMISNMGCLFSDSYGLTFLLMLVSVVMHLQTPLGPIFLLLEPTSCVHDSYLTGKAIAVICVYSDYQSGHSVSGESGWKPVVTLRCQHHRSHSTMTGWEACVHSFTVHSRGTEK